MSSNHTSNDLMQRFCQQASINASILSRIQQLDQAIPLISEFLLQRGLPGAIRLSPELAREWPVNATLATSAGTTNGEHPVCASRAWAALADTGTLVLRSGPDSPTGLNFLADYHLVFVREERILANKTALWPWLEQEGQALPRALNFISGPSRTADIEQTIQLGAHGPRQLWIFLQSGD